MEKKELIKLYLQNVDKMFGYANMNAYIDERLKKYTKYCQSKKPEEQIIIWLKLLHENFGKKIVYLGSYLALQEKDMSYLNNAFNSAVTWGQLTITNNVKKNTLAGRKYLMDALKQDKLGSRSIDSIKPSDAKEWAVRMKEKGYGFKTISNYKRSLKASFYMAIEDDYVRKNPFDFQLSEVIDDDSESRQALSEEQEEKLLSFLQYDTVYQKYYDDVLILLKTGLRISELCGLTVQDLDFENHTLNINHQLLRNQEGYYIETPKTKCGIRKVPMSEEAGKAFQRVLKRKKTGKGIVIDGYRNFLFLNQKGMPMTACYYTSTLRNIVKKYNKYHDEPLPKITPHILRHTFCTRLAQKNMNPKNLQYIMGHSSIMITLNLYAHASQTGANMEMRSLIA